MIYLRIISFLFLIISVVVFPLPVALAVFILSVSFFQGFWEGALAGVLIDALYAPVSFYGLSFGFFTLCFVAVILIEEKAKSLIRNKGVLSRLIIAVCCGALFYLFFLLLS